MYTIEVFLNFSAAHRLRKYKGKCENIHGHNWKWRICLFKGLNDIGIVADFRTLKRLSGPFGEIDIRI